MQQSSKSSSRNCNNCCRACPLNQLHSHDVNLWCKDVQPIYMYPIKKDINSLFSAVSICLQKGWTATLKAAYKGHLTVLETLVKQYDGNVLHRMKVQCSDDWCFDNVWWTLCFPSKTDLSMLECGLWMWMWAFLCGWQVCNWLKNIRKKLCRIIMIKQGSPPLASFPALALPRRLLGASLATPECVMTVC